MDDGFAAFRSRVDAYYGWRQDAHWATRLLLVLGWACLMGLLAQLRVPLPFTPVPFTMQVFGVLLGGVLLGRRDGSLAQLAYVGVGVAGVPWFQGLNGGVAYVLGATGGYLFAMPMAAWLVGALVEDSGVRSLRGLVLTMTAGIGVIYAVGATWLAIALQIDIARAVAIGVAPFVVADLAKALLAAALARAVVPPTASR